MRNWLARIPWLTGAILFCAAWLAWLALASDPPEAVSDFAAWAQAIGTILAILGSVWVGYAHSDRQRLRQRADQFTAAATLAYAAGEPIIKLHTWLEAKDRSVVLSQSQAEERDRFKERWRAWIPARNEGYLAGLQLHNFPLLDDGQFMKNLITVRTRLAWTNGELAPALARGRVSAEFIKLAKAGADDTLGALIQIADRANRARKAAGLPKVPFSLEVAG